MTETLPLVLIVDEAFATRRRLPELLSRHGYTALVANSGRHAVELLKHDRPIAIVVAAALADMTGSAFIERVREFDAEIPIVGDAVGDDVLLNHLARWSHPIRQGRKERWPGRVLVVDDEPKLRQVLQEFLELHGFAASAVASGEDALAQLDRLAPSVVLLDMMMPGMNGLDALKQIKARRPSTMVIMITGLEEERVMDEALALGAHDYITKPFNLEYLETMLLSKILLGQTP